MTDTVFLIVSTPSFFQEIEVPADEDEWTPRQRQQVLELEADAERHGTSIERSNYRRG